MRKRMTTTMAGWMTAARWTVADARSALGALAESGEPVTQFAARHGVGAHRLYEWRRRLSTIAPRPAFVEVERGAMAPPAGSGTIEVVLTTGDLLRVRAPVDVTALERVVGVLRRVTAC